MPQEIFGICGHLTGFDELKAEGFLEATLSSGFGGMPALSTDLAPDEDPYVEGEEEEELPESDETSS